MTICFFHKEGYRKSDRRFALSKSNPFWRDDFYYKFSLRTFCERRAISMEYFAMIALILVLATGYIVVLSKAADHDNENNKK